MVAATKKTTISDRQCTFNLIVRALTVADFTIDQAALLEINRKIATMGGGDSHHVKKSASLCSASVCFLLGVLALRKIRSPAPPKKLAGRLGLEPLLMGK